MTDRHNTSYRGLPAAPPPPQSQSQPRSKSQPHTPRQLVYDIPRAHLTRMALHGLLLTACGALLLAISRPALRQPYHTEDWHTWVSWGSPPGENLLLIDATHGVVGLGISLLLGSAYAAVWRGRLTTSRVVGLVCAGIVASALSTVVFNVFWYAHLPPEATDVRFALLPMASTLAMTAPLVMVGWLWLTYLTARDVTAADVRGQGAEPARAHTSHPDIPHSHTDIPHADVPHADNAVDSPGVTTTVDSPKDTTTAGVDVTAARPRQATALARPGQLLSGVHVIVIVAACWWIVPYNGTMLDRALSTDPRQALLLPYIPLAVAIAAILACVWASRMTGPGLFGYLGNAFTLPVKGQYVRFPRPPAVKFAAVFALVSIIFEATRLGFVIQSKRLIPAPIGPDAAFDLLHPLFMQPPHGAGIHALLPTLYLVPEEAQLVFPITRVLDAAVLGLALHTIYPVLHPGLVRWLPRIGVLLAALGALFPHLVFGRDQFTTQGIIFTPSWVTLVWQAALFVLLVYPLVVACWISIGSHRGLGQDVPVVASARAIIAAVGLLGIVTILPQAMVNPFPGAQAWQVSLRGSIVFVAAMIATFDVCCWLAGRTARAQDPAAAQAAQAHTTAAFAARRGAAVVAALCAVAGVVLIAVCWPHYQALTSGAAPQWLLWAVCSAHAFFGAAVGCAAAWLLTGARADKALQQARTASAATS